MCNLIQPSGKTVDNYAKSLINKITLIVLTCLITSGFSIIRDAEIENSLAEISSPIFKAANLDPNHVDFYLINSKEINAFVMGGMNIFITTELFMREENPEMLMGVIAHETGHIIGGHLARKDEVNQDAMASIAIGYLLSVGAVIAGSPEAAGAIATGSGNILQRNILKHNRIQENEADQTALNIMQKLSISTNPMIGLLKYLFNKSLAGSDNINPYSQTHPLSIDRINFFTRNPVPNKPLLPQKLENFKRSVVKMRAFLWDPNQVLKIYNGDNDTAIYAQSIAWFRKFNLEKSLSLIDKLLMKYPLDPYYNQLKGQILFENGKVADAFIYYQKADKLLPNNSQIKLYLAIALIALEQQKNLDKAIDNLQFVIRKEPYNSFAYQQLSIAYGRNGDIGESYLYLGEAELIQRDYKKAIRYANLALDKLAKNSPAAIRAGDLKSISTERNKNKSPRNLY